MVSVGLYTRSVIPTIRSITNNLTEFSTTSTAFQQVAHTVTTQDGETAFLSGAVRNNSGSGTSYGYHSWSEIRDGSTVLATSDSYHGATTYPLCEHRNSSGAPKTYTLHVKCEAGRIAVGYWIRILIMNDSDLAKWERVNLPTTRYRKYAVDKYYMLAKLTLGSFNIDGYAIDIYGGGIVEVPVETIVSSTELVGSSAHFFQVTGQGFTVTA